MTDKEFLEKIEGTINDACDGTMDREEAAKSLFELFMEALNPLIKSKEHLQLFIYRVHTMRKMQVRYFDGQKSVLWDSKKLETLVDNAIKKMTEELGYTIEDIAARYEQKKMF